MGPINSSITYKGFRLRINVNRTYCEGLRVGSGDRLVLVVSERHCLLLMTTMILMMMMMMIK